MDNVKESLKRTIEEEKAYQKTLILKGKQERKTKTHSTICEIIKSALFITSIAGLFNSKNIVYAITKNNENKATIRMREIELEKLAMSLKSEKETESDNGNKTEV